MRSCSNPWSVWVREICLRKWNTISCSIPDSYWLDKEYLLLTHYSIERTVRTTLQLPDEFFTGFASWRELQALIFKLKADAVIFYERCRRMIRQYLTILRQNEGALDTSRCIDKRTGFSLYFFRAYLLLQIINTIFCKNVIQSLPENRNCSVL